jgi:hypothetical protein
MRLFCAAAGTRFMLADHLRQTSSDAVQTSVPQIWPGSKSSKYARGIRSPDSVRGALSMRIIVGSACDRIDTTARELKTNQPFLVNEPFFWLFYW